MLASLTFRSRETSAGQELVLDELLGDGGAALRQLPLDHVLHQGPGDAAEVDAAVLVEAGVLHRPVLAKTAVFPAWDVLGYDVPLRRTFSRARHECRFAASWPQLPGRRPVWSMGCRRSTLLGVPMGSKFRGPGSANVLRARKFCSWPTFHRAWSKSV